MRKFLLAGLLLWPSLVLASGLYSVAVTLPPNQTAEDSGPQTRAVQTVLERLTGYPVDGDLALAPLLASPSEWIASSGYQTELDEVSRTLSFRIDPSIRSALVEAGVPVWTQPRPPQWLWLIVNEGGERKPLNGQDSSELLVALNEQAERWQLPLALPEWDQTDLNRVNPAELWGLFTDGVERASQRYSSEFTAGRVFRMNDQWQISVKTHDDRRLNQSYESATELAEALYRFWLPPVVAEYAITGQGTSDLAVYNLDPAGYKELMSFLRAQDAIERAWPVYSTNQVSVIRLITGARPDQLENLLAQVPRLESSSTADLEWPVELSVNWRR